jgi:signal transduction histidine kinase
VRDEAIRASVGDGKSDRGSPLLTRIATTWRSLPGFPGGIGWRLLVRVLLFSLLITLLLTVIQLYLDYRRDVQAIDMRMSEIDSSYRRSLGEGLWRLDARQLQLQVRGILHLPDIGYVELREATDRAAPLVVTAGSHEANAPIRSEFRILYDVRGTEQLLGILLVEANFDRIYRQLFDTAVKILVSQGIQTFVVSFFILLIVHRLITRHLTEIASSLRGYDLHGPQIRLRLERSPPRQADELDSLVAAFNDMFARLKNADDHLRDSERQLAHANRVATVGQLSASIAHEVNQPITGAIMNAHAALRSLGADPPRIDVARAAIERILRDGNRAGDVIERVRALIKKAPARRDVIDFNEAVVEIMRLAQGEVARRRVSVQTRLADDLLQVAGDRVQLQQVILNLIINAAEAMGAVPEGSWHLTITTDRADGGEVLVAVQDSGPGIDPSHLDRIFDAFYTTKVSGLGMGLSISRSIIEAHGGRLWATSGPQGALFQLTLPAWPESRS